MLMSLLFGTSKSSHVLFSQKARKLFKDKKTGDRIIEEISKNKRAISEGGNIRIELTNGNKPKDYITLEGVSEAHLEK